MDILKRIDLKKFSEINGKLKEFQNFFQKQNNMKKVKEGGLKQKNLFSKE